MRDKRVKHITRNRCVHSRRGIHKIDVNAPIEESSAVKIYSVR